MGPLASRESECPTKSAFAEDRRRRRRTMMDLALWLLCVVQELLLLLRFVSLQSVLRSTARTERNFSFLASTADQSTD